MDGTASRGGSADSARREALGAAKVQQTLAHWWTDADLAGLRDSDALEKLPPAKRKAYGQLWTDLDALLERAQAPK